MEAVDQAHVVPLLTEWGEFKSYDWAAIYGKMYKPAFVFDGSNILDAAKLTAIGL